MADKTATLLVKLKDQASKGINKVKSALGGFKVSALAAGAGLAALGVFLKKSFDAWGVQKEAVLKLDQSLKTLNGVAMPDASKRLQKLAGDLQKVTTFGDEVTISSMAMLSSFGLNEASITKLIPRLQDMATAQNVDLKTATLALGKAIGTGQVGALSRYGVALDETTFKLDPVGSAVEGLTKSFDGQAKAIRTGPAGALVALKNLYGDVMETIGEAIEGPMVGMIEKLSEIGKAIQDNKSAIMTFIEVIVYLGESIMNVFEFAGEIIGNFMFVFMEMVEAIMLAIEGDFAGAWEKMKDISSLTLESLVGDFDDLVTKQSNAFKKVGKANKKMIADDKKNKKDLLKNKQVDAKQTFEWQQKNNEKLLKQEQEKNAKNKKEAEKVIADGMKLRAKDKADFKAKEDKELAEEQARKAQRLSDAQGFFSTISTLQSSKNKELFAIGKAASIANATVDTFTGVAKAWSFGPILGPVFAALVLAAGMAQVHQIAATSMAEGGIVSPTAGGTLVRVAEAGQAEAIVPLDDEEGGGFGGATINLNVGTLVADEDGIDQLAKTLDDTFYGMQRNNETITF